MVLAIDSGNTTTNFGVFAGADLFATRKLPVLNGELQPGVVSEGLQRAAVGVALEAGADDFARRLAVVAQQMKLDLLIDIARIQHAFREVHAPEEGLPALGIVAEVDVLPAHQQVQAPRGRRVRKALHHR